MNIKTYRPMKNIIEFLLKDDAFTTLVMLSLTICFGLSIGRIRIKSFSIGVIAILFAGMFLGIACNKFNIEINTNMSNILKDFGLILFIFTVGLQVGPSFFSSLKRGGALLNLQAISIVILGMVITILICFFGRESPDTMAGVYSGAISSTPGLSAAQETIKALGLGDADAVAAGYALTYPIGVIVPIICCILIRRICKVRLDKENKSEVANEMSLYDNKTKSSTGKSVIVIFGGILIGLFIGSIAIHVTIKGVTVPLKLGYTGGPLVMAILMGHFGTKWGWIDSTVTSSSGTSMLREIGIAIFLALVGLASGSKLLEISILSGSKWILYGLAIAIFPTLVVGLFVRLHHKTNYFTLMGLIGGATTDTPALAYANNIAAEHAEGLPAAAYAAVYPLTVLLRIVTAQLFVLVMV